MYDFDERIDPKEGQRKDFIGKEATERDAIADNSLAGEGIVYPADDMPIVLAPSGLDTSFIKEWLHELRFEKNKRPGSGMAQRSIYTNSTGRVPWRDDCCNISKFSVDYPELQRELNKIAQRLSDAYKAWLPDEHHKHVTRVFNSKEKIRKDYRIGKTPFTSGIINKDSSLTYHVDDRNLKGTISAMLVLTEGMRGGNLVLPEYKMTIELNDGDIVMFNGGNIVHGVSPMQAYLEKAFRYSIVFYTLAGMHECLGLDDEKRRINRRA